MRKIAIALASLLVTVSFATSAAAAVQYETEVLYGVSFRDKPSVDGYKYRMLSTGEDIHVIEKYNSYWLKIQTGDGKIGYISSNSKYTDYTASSTVTNTSTSSGTTSTSSSLTYETEVLYGVSFRDQPSTNGSRYRYLSQGEDIHVIEQVNSYWLKVQTKDGTVGYISSNSKYTDYQAPAPGTSTSTNTTTQEATTSVSRTQIVASAKSYVGTFDYQWGAEPWTTNNQYTDCSAFVELVFRNYGIDLPRSSRDQAKEGTYVSKSNLMPGDLIFFDTNKDGIINHVGIYIGDNQFAHASPSIDGVGISSFSSSYWGDPDRYVTARAILD